MCDNLALLIFSLFRHMTTGFEVSRKARCLSPLLALSLLCSLSCNKRDLPRSTTETPTQTAPAQASASAQSEQTAADVMDSDLIPPEDISSETMKDAKSGPLVLPTSFGRRTGDLDEMLKERRIRALVVINPIGFFYSNGKPKGMTYETLEQLQAYVNKKLTTGKFDVKITFIPLRPDELGPALAAGIGDVIAQGVVITPGRHRNFAFTTPTKRGVTHIVVTGKELANVRSFDDLIGVNIYANPLTVAYDRLTKINEERAKVGKSLLSVKAADKNLLEDDLVEMVNGGLISATAVMQHRAALWAQVLPNIKLHPQLMVTNDGELAWVVRKNNPSLQKVLDEFIEKHGEGTSFGNVLLRRYLKNTNWVNNSTSAQEMKKFSEYVQYFKKYASQYSFDYLMLMAQGYQDSLLDQGKKSPSGAVGIMQVIPKYASAAPINVPDVSKADKNILAGVRMLNNIVTNYFADPAIDEVNRTLFTFASYNAGPNRIVRLRKQAAKEGLNPNKWFGNVELEVARDIGEETVTYVDNIYKYYVAYKLAAERQMERNTLKSNPPRGQNR
jgi:membrane-bound lytic murein transglycosylase MltF